MKFQSPKSISREVVKTVMWGRRGVAELGLEQCAYRARRTDCADRQIRRVF